MLHLLSLNKAEELSVCVKFQTELQLHLIVVLSIRIDHGTNKSTIQHQEHPGAWEEVIQGYISSKDQETYSEC